MSLAERSSELQQVIGALDIGDEFFWEPLRLARPGAWTGHLATAFWLVKVIRPGTFVELGTHSGNSYSAFCQAISGLGLPSQAFAIDTWKGDEHAGFYDDSIFQELNAFNQSHFSGFSRLVRSTFDEARSYFADGSIDLLHIDGLHTYEAVKHDFETWKSAASPSAVVVFHDIKVREKGFGVWQLWQELSSAYPSFEFHHSEGLGILGLGPHQPPQLTRLLEMGRNAQLALTVRQLFAARGETFLSRARCLDTEYLVSVYSQRASEAEAARHQLANLQANMTAVEAELSRLRQVEATAREQGPAVAKAMNDAAAIPAMTAELERLRKVEESAREHAAVVSRLAGDAASARAEAEGYKRSATALETEFQRMRSDLTDTRQDLAAAREDLVAAHEEHSSLAEQGDRARDELSATRSQLDASMSLARQQSLTSQRSLMEVISVRQELDRCKAEFQQELDGYKAAYQEAAALLIPLRVRRALPEPLKAPLRAIKRALRSLTRRTP